MSNKYEDTGFDNTFIRIIAVGFSTSIIILLCRGCGV